MAKLDIARRWRIVHLRDEKWSRAQIADKVKCNVKTVDLWLRRYRITGGVDAKRVSGRPVSLDTAARRRAAQLLIAGEVGGARYVSRRLKAEGLSSTVLSTSTVLRGAREQAQLDGDPLVCVRGRPRKGLTQDTKNKRLAFATANATRNWRHVMITDRCKFHFRYPGTAVRPTRWRTKSTKGDDTAFQPNRPSVYNVYGGITAYGVTKLHSVTGTSKEETSFKNGKGEKARNITKAEYGDVVSDTLLPEGRRIFAQKGVANWHLQQDNDPCHGAANGPIQAFNDKGRGGVQLVQGWPGNSPDLSPIENVWGWVDARVAEKGCKTFEEFRLAVDETFANIPITTLEKLIGSIPRRLARVKETQGGKCGY